jgi:hypothetical protein
VDGQVIRIVVSSEIRAHHDELRRLIHEGFADIDACGVEVWVDRALRSWDSFTGRAYSELPSRPRPHPATRYLVRLKIPSVLRNRGYPKSYRYPQRKTAPSITARDWRERFVALVAHEAFHVRQFREGLRRSEVAAERWALSILEQWRVGLLDTRLPAGLESVIDPPGGARQAASPDERLPAAASRWEQLSLLA